MDPGAWAPPEAMQILFASTNPGKIAEVAAILSAADIRVRGLDEALTTTGERADQLPEPEETGATFKENAAIKARAYALATGRLCLADDSGLEVDALDGAPGVHSAYYAHGWKSRGAPRAERDAANNEKLLKELEGVGCDYREARFVCAMCLASGSGAILATARGEFAGVIATEPRGEGGFGYDPLLVLEDGRTSAELSAEEKNARSHRGAAARAMAEKIREVVGGRGSAGQ